VGQDENKSVFLPCAGVSQLKKSGSATDVNCLAPSMSCACHAL